MQNPVLSHAVRQKNVANMLATLRIEKLGPSESLKPAIQAYVDGNKSTSDLLNEVKAKYDQPQSPRQNLNISSVAKTSVLFLSCCFDDQA